MKRSVVSAQRTVDYGLNTKDIGLMTNIRFEILVAIRYSLVTGISPNPYPVYVG